MHIIKLAILFLFLLQSISANSLDKVLNEAILNNEEIKGITKNNEAYRLYVDEEKSSYYPKLDLQAYVEKINEVTTSEGSPEDKKNRQGSFIQLNLEQVLFEGGLTGAKVEESNHKYRANKFANFSKTEAILHNTIKSYLDFIKYDELIKLSKVNILVQSDYLETAIENEKISGSSLERMQVESKISYANSKLNKQIEYKLSAGSKLKKNIGKDVTTKVCRPLINQKYIPVNIEKAYSKALLNNYEIKEQIEKIKVQNALIEQSKSAFKPKVVAKVKKSIDNGLDVTDSKSDELSGRIELNYNLFNGFRDDSTIQREKTFLKEAKNILYGLEHSLKDKVKVSYLNYNNSSKRVDFLKEYVQKNIDILSIYKEQFEGGTRSFIDILNHENEIYRAKQELIEEEFGILLSYYSMQTNFSYLSESILENKQTVCKEFNIEYEPRKLIVKNSNPELSIDLLVKDEISLDILEDVNIDKEVNRTIENSEEVKKMLSNIMGEIYNQKDITKSVKKKNIKIKIKEKIIPKVDDLDFSGNSLFQKFNNLDENTYTIAIAAVKATQKELNSFIKRYNLEDKVFMFKIGTKREYTRVLYGNYKTVDEAQLGIDELHPGLINNRPYISSIKNQREAFLTFNNQEGK
jgi:adhesin transport system outer membrane protein